MKKITYSIPVLLLLFILTGCGIPSVHPLYNPDDLVVKEELSGKWKKKENSDVYNVFHLQDLKVNEQVRDTLGIKEDDSLIAAFEEINLDNTYLIVESDIGEADSEIFVGGLVKLDKNYYLDLYKYPGFSADNFSYPVHLFVKVDLHDDKIVMHQFREQWIKELIKKREIRIKHEVSFDNFLLTASTNDLQAFIRKYGDNPKAYDGDELIFNKIND
ncbi:LptM family lipoprotein [Fodinibius halophilus]|uniref:Lipoprotein n=1 Tax=Fodinibius halophilus TaxID=1736908 RepID=A0A6M1TH21_9BACT|nr:hypothetical protein [Fodinibius halophilus]NGP87950.1 hypothetical protein [Fodinibius halophilus]